MPKLAYIFDLDGTLVDSLADIGDAMNFVLEHHGLPTHSDEAFKSFIGHGAAYLVRCALPKSHSAYVDRFLIEFRADYGRRLTRRSRPYPGILAMLAELQSLAIPTAVLSNKPHAPTVEIVRTFFGLDRFVDVLGHREEFEAKPDPVQAFMLSDKLGTSAQECVFVGDTEVDIETAKRAGMRSIGVTWGFRPKQALVEADADHVVENVDELCDLIHAHRQPT